MAQQKKKQGKKGGRPTRYTKKLAELICKRIAEGKSVRRITMEKDMPSSSMVYRWLQDHDEFWEKYTRARDIQAELMAEEVIGLSDESIRDIEGDDKSDNARVAARKLQADSRKWYLSKVKPKKYGDKVDLTSGGKDLGHALADFLKTDPEAGREDDQE